MSASLRSHQDRPITKWRKVMRDIRNLLEQGVAAHNFVETSYTDKSNRQSPMYTITKKGCLILVTGEGASLRSRKEQSHNT